MSKISELLSDEESVKQLSELAQMIMAEKNEEQPSDEKKSDQTSPDFSDIMKLTSLAGALSENDKNTDLLLALRPHLSEERQKRVDKAVKIMRISSLYSLAKENGMLEDIL